MQKILPFYLIGIVLFISSCGYFDRKKAIVNSWKVTNIQIFPLDSIPQDPPELEKIEYQINYTFRSDGTYEVAHQKEKDRGRWMLSEDQKVLLLNSAENDQDDAEFIIESFIREEIIISTQTEDVKEIITLQTLN